MLTRAISVLKSQAGSFAPPQGTKPAAREKAGITSNINTINILIIFSSDFAKSPAK